MSLAVILSRARLGLTAPPVAVEVHLSNGLPSLSIVGMPETAVKESKDRVRSAILNSRFDFPARRITVNLAPADLPKSGGQFDLPIALGILSASGQLPEVDFTNTEFIGELGLNGELRNVAGCLPAALACAKVGRSLCCPALNAAEAALSDETEVLAGNSLLHVCAHLTGVQEIPPQQRSLFNINPFATNISPDLADVRGQLQARRALEIAAAGRHHLLLYGPPGTGKSMLASRLPGLLPPMSKEAAVEVASIQSIIRHHTLCTYPERPFSSPHHTASAVSLVGGGSNPKPGEISLAHHGVLFLDELPEFQRSVLEVLREPLESGSIRISRANAQVEFPAQFQLVAAMNPCPCGYYGDSSNKGESRCQCSSEQVRRYRAKISGPLLDRIDMHVPVLPLRQGDLFNQAPGEDSRTVQQRVIHAHQTQIERQQCNNAQLSNADLLNVCNLSNKQQDILENAMLHMGFSARALHRIEKVALTIMDLDGQSCLQDKHLMEAFSYRNLDRQP